MHELDHPFAYHKPDENEIRRIERLREAAQEFYEALWENTRPGSVSGRYRALSKTALEEAMMWASKSVVFERDNDPEER